MTKWYRVTAFALNVRSGPGTSYEDIGSLQQGDVVKALDYAVANSWIKIYRPSDGLTGWSYATYLQETTAPSDTGDPPDKENHRIMANRLPGEIPNGIALRLHH